MSTPATAQPPESLVRLTHLIYGLHAFSALMGIISTAAIVTAFLTGWPSILAVILNYAKRAEARGTYLESHFSWQIRTFWAALGWFVLAIFLFVTLIGIPIAFLIWIADTLWVFYRVIRGVLLFKDSRPIPGM